MLKHIIFTFITFLVFKADCEDTLAEFDPVVLDDILDKEDIYFGETFNNELDFKNKWVISQSKKDGVDSDLGKYDGDWTLDIPIKHGIQGDYGLTFKERAKHRAITAKLYKPFKFQMSPLVVQYEVTFQDGQECGGGYMKLYSEDKNDINLKDVHDKSPYTIMFGPDKCGNVNKIHFIFRHKNPLNGSYEEKHSKAPSTRFDEVFTDAKPHLFTLVISPNNRYKVLIDQQVAIEGSLLQDFTPPVNPPAEINDPDDKKPEDWDEREKIPDPTAIKPADWDDDAPRTILDPKAVKPKNWLDNEPIDIVDPSAEKPDDWDEEMDGVWEAPLVPNPACEDAPGCGPWSRPSIPNPAYKGKWTPSLINNPAYRGKWVPKKIANPNYFEDRDPFQMTPVVAVGLELWSMSANILFDNFLICDDEKFAQVWTDLTYGVKIKRINKSSESLWGKLMKRMNYKPGWWALYFVYCLLPISGYVWYLWWRVQEVSFLNEILEFSNKYPWLWAIYTLVLLIPVTLLVYFCFWTRKDSHNLSCRRRAPDSDDAHQIVQDDDNISEKNAGEECKDSDDMNVITDEGVRESSEETDAVENMVDMLTEPSNDAEEEDHESETEPVNEAVNEGKANEPAEEQQEPTSELKKRIVTRKDD